MLGKCLGCHVKGAGALAPLSLEGIDRVNSLKPAIQHALENRSMPPEGSMQLSKGEHSKFMAWLNGVPLHPQWRVSACFHSSKRKRGTRPPK